MGTGRDAIPSMITLPKEVDNDTLTPPLERERELRVTLEGSHNMIALLQFEDMQSMLPPLILALKKNVNRGIKRLREMEERR